MNSTRVAIIADDLTGALDVSAPFARRGLRCRVAVTGAGVEDALGIGAEVVCINTASREDDAATARAEVARVAGLLAAVAPVIAMHKIDSRLKGHVADGIAVCMARFGRPAAVVAPAVPGQGRFVEDGRIIGKGVSEPIDIEGKLGAHPGVTIADGTSDGEMREIARRHQGDLLVGASGLGLGLAEVLTGRDASPLVSVQRPLLIAIGSHDPVTLAQIEALSALEGFCVVETTDGTIDAVSSAEVTLVRALSDPGIPGHGEVLGRFGLAVADQLRSGRFASALLCGGETAQTVLEALGIVGLDVIGEALPGIPVSQAQLAGGGLTILTKSGGFGTPDDLLRISQAARPTTPIDPLRAEIPA